MDEVLRQVKADDESLRAELEARKKPRARRVATKAKAPARARKKKS
jgi:hypothetical protein